jgi:hypothetical protein
MYVCMYVCIYIYEKPPPQNKTSYISWEGRGNQHRKLNAFVKVLLAIISTFAPNYDSCIRINDSRL